MTVLHLASWYPSEVEPYNGDFIQRHLLALSLYTKVTVMAVVKDVSMPAGTSRVVRRFLNDQFEEKIVYYGAVTTKLPVLDRFISFSQYSKYFFKLVREYIQTNCKPDLLHVHVAMNAGPVARLISKKWGIPYVLTEHSSIYHRTAKENLWNRSYVWRTLNLKVVQEAVAVFPVSMHLGKRISELVPVQSLQVIDNVVDTSLFYYKPVEHSSLFLFIHVSGMNEPKNVEGLLRGLAILKSIRTNWQITMVGPADSKLKQLAIDLSVDSLIEWIGEVDYPSVANFIQRSHAHVLFSRYENQPCVNLEALCCGLPVIATKVGGISEVVHEKNGILIPALDETALATAMARMMDNYAQFDRIAISAEAKNRFSYNVVGKRMLEQYSKVLSKLAS